MRGVVGGGLLQEVFLAWADGPRPWPGGPRPWPRSNHSWTAGPASLAGQEISSGGRDQEFFYFKSRK